MIDRLLISLAGGLVAAVSILVGAWIIISAYQVISWQIPVAAGVAVTLALFTVDFLTDWLAKRQQPKP